MNKLIFLAITVFALVSSAECPPGDPNCVMRDGGAGTNLLGLDCAGCRALEKSKVRLGGTSTNYTPGANSNSAVDSEVGTGN